MKTWYRKIVVAILVLLLLASSHALADKRVALVVGNSDYAYVPRLRNTINDARDVAGELRKLGFQTLEAIDVSRDQMRRYVDSFASAIRGADLGLFFYAGHGIAVNGINYVIPVDALPRSMEDVNRQLVPVDEVVRVLLLEPRQTVVMLDACRNNPFVPILQKFGVRSVSRGLAPVRRQPRLGAGGLSALETGNINMFVAFATQPGKVASDGLSNDTHSPFSKALITHIGQRIEIRELMLRVRSTVANRTRNFQIPWDQSSLIKPIYLAGKPEPRVQYRTRPATRFVMPPP